MLGSVLNSMLDEVCAMVLKVPIGIDDFKEVIEGGFVYVDKTLMIEEVQAQPAKVLLLPRPRRFGKTLCMSMLAHFFDLASASRDLFRGLAIESRPCFERQGTAPVLFISFKNLKAPSYELFLRKFRALVKRLYRDHLYLSDQLGTLDREDFYALAKGVDDPADLASALFELSQLLYQHHGKQVVLLIDEYDSPIHEGYAAGYYEQVIGFMRDCLGSALKGNSALEKAVLTGILRVAKESIFSDLNNVDVFTLLERPFADKFGFTEDETAALLQRAGLSDHMAKVRGWYNGYLIGDTVIYNPWSLLKFMNNPSEGCRPYWVNTSANLLVREQLLHASVSVQDALKSLLNGGVVQTTISDQTVFRDLQRDDSTLWSFLLFSGYLTVASWEEQDRDRLYNLRVPNEEVLWVYEDIILGWLRREVGTNEVEGLLRALLEADIPMLQERLANLVAATLSYYDTGGKGQERVYHMFVLGLLAHLSGRYTIRSNRESGLGRYDLMMLPKNPADRGIIMEFKAATDSCQLEPCLEAALAQMESRHYAQELEAAGITHYSEIAVAFFGKQVALRARHCP